MIEYTIRDFGVKKVRVHLDNKLVNSKVCKSWLSNWPKTCSVVVDLKLKGKHTVKVAAVDTRNRKTEKSWTAELIVDLPPKVELNPPGGEFIAESIPYPFKFIA